MSFALPWTDEQVRRFSRQILVPEIGGRGQRRLLAATVEVSGHGLAAQVCVLYLAAAGIGTIVTSAQDTRARSIHPAVRIVPAAAAPEPRDARVLVSDPRSPPEAWITGSMAAIDVLKQLLGLAKASP